MLAQAAQPPTYFEIISFIADAAVPIVLTVLGVRIFQLTSAIEQSQWLNQKMIEKRISVYDEVAPLINDLYCYLRWVGNWKELTPEEALDRKRRIDKTIYVNEVLFSEDLKSRYFTFITLCFQTKHGPGQDARLRTPIVSALGNRRNLPRQQWKQEWKRYFVPDCYELPAEECEWSNPELVASAYQDLMLQFAEEIGVRRVESRAQKVS